MPKALFDVHDVLAALELAVERRPKGYCYPKTASTCVYMYPGGKPKCLIGVMLIDVLGI
jgi:hypothetical protein